MKGHMTGTEAWEEVKSIIEAKIAECRLLLDTAHKNANQTFVERRSKVQSNVLVETLKTAQVEMTQNYAASENQLDFCIGMLAKNDALLRENVSAVREHTGQGSTASFRALVELAELTELESSAKISVTTAKIAFDALLLCSILAALLGHEEAIAFEEGAKKELIGALGDPGAGVLMLLKRLYAVGTRTLRTDQDADKLLMSLEKFHKSMNQWRQVCVMISQDVPLDQALFKVFENDAV